MRRHAQSKGSCIPQRQQRGSSVPTSPGVGWEEPPGLPPPRLGPWGQGWCQAAVLGLELGRTGTLLTVALWSFTREQARLKTSVVEEDTEEWQKDSRFTGLERVGGVDLSYIKGDDTSACASLVVLSYPALEVLYEDCRMVAVSAPYVAGFLAFREVPFLVEAVQRLQQEEPKLRPQVVLVDGNGLLHPRGFGVACHLGVLTDLPCIGVAKNLLHVDGVVRDELHREQIRSLQRGGDTFPLTGTSGRVLGMVLRSYNSSKPLYISVGHKVCLETAVRLVKSCCRYRIPEPIRQADIRSREYIRKQLCSPLEVVSSGPERKKEAELDD
ncbi:endonuclease V isoform X2 [Falco biarmicus]|uniref:endonuclease V isoform X2 n=2 Tax=Falco TaxID=8952 RepID=UPI0018868236|nr:endonuclease V isoform X2 [Falco peregrinus]XP_027657096.2 endonuclease V isoform X2 [Falco cherrug]XP_037259632.1 endonuclease V isoform X2 [Falco rusticolus]XP_056191198.1 endonuclease V isoform X2 [Falco biarmicus]